MLDPALRLHHYMPNVLSFIVTTIVISIDPAVITTTISTATTVLKVRYGAAIGMYHHVLKAHASLGEPAQAVTLIKDMRARGLPLRASTCSLLLSAFCKANALQVSIRS